jgi:hypothetical protein
MAVVVVIGSGFVFLPPVPCTTSHLPEVCLFDSDSFVSRHCHWTATHRADKGGRRCRVATLQALKEDE